MDRKETDTPIDNCSPPRDGGTEKPPRVTLSEAQRCLVESHLGLVGHVTFQVATNFPRHVDRDELRTAGALGLVEAASRFDPELGVPFERFAVKRIRGAILDQVRTADWAPRSVRQFNRMVEATEQALTTELGEKPTEEQVAEEMEMSVEALRKLRDKAYRSVTLSLDYDINDGDEDLTLLEVLSDPVERGPLDELELQELKSLALDAAESLPYKQRLAVVGFFFEDKPNRIIAKELGVTDARVSQLRQEGIDMIRHIFGTRYEEMGKFINTSTSSIVRRNLGHYEGRVSSASSWRNRPSGARQLPKSAAPQRPERRVDIARQVTMTTELSPAELRGVFRYFLFNDNSRLEEMRRQDPKFNYIDKARFARIRERISRDLSERGIEIQWDSSGERKRTRYTIRILKGADELEKIVYGTYDDQ